MAAVVIPQPLLRSDRRRVTLQDCYYVDPAQSPFSNSGYSPSVQSPFGMIDCSRARPRAHTISFNIPSAEAQILSIAQATSCGERSPAGIGGYGYSPAAVARLHSCSPTFMPDTSPVNDVPLPARRRTQRAKTVGALPCSHVAISVIAPGGGTGMNASVYAMLARRDGCSVDIVGQSRAAYDCYPASWGNEGAPAPNLETFTLDLISQKRLANTDCLVVGSRGGQVVLPTLWKVLGDDVPPAVVMNGGCAMALPTPVHWPAHAATFLLLGGQDYFRSNMSMNDYVADAKNRVPQENTSTAILLVREMVHMPQAELLNGILEHMVRAVTSWKETDCIPVDGFSTILGNLRRGGWTGVLTFKSGTGNSWNTEAFP